MAETDDELMEKYFEGEEITVDELKRAMRKACLRWSSCPCRAARPSRTKVCSRCWMRSSTTCRRRLICRRQGHEARHRGRGAREPSDDAPFSASAFKIMADPYVGKLAFFRVYSGALKAGSYVYNPAKGKRERVGPHRADARQPPRRARRGVRRRDRGRGRVADTATGDTLCDESHPILLESPDFPEPVIAQAIEPKTKADQDKLGVALQRLTEEDPTFHVRTDEETGQTTIHGMGELHLEVIVDRLLREFKVEANIGKPQVAYRETLQAGQGRRASFMRQSGGRGQYGHVILEIEPMEPGAGFEFVNKIVGGVVPREYIPAVEAGVKEAMLTGVLAGYPVVDVR